MVEGGALAGPRDRCEVVQGYYYSKPLPADEYPKWVRSHNHREARLTG